MGNAALVGIGIFAGVYLLLTLGWILGAARLQLVAQLFLEPVAFQITLWLAVIALPLWFATVFWLTSGKRSWLRFTLLAAGALLLIPWPFIRAGVFRRAPSNRAGVFPCLPSGRSRRSPGPSSCSTPT
jgi:hypothetical protein